MNDIFKWPRFRTLALLLSLCLVSGCGNREALTVKLQARVLPQEPTTLMRIDAQIAGPVDGLHYKWFAVSGECEPQQSDEPKTIFRFPEGVRQDRVTVEVWRNDQRLAESEINVRYEGEYARREQLHPAGMQIEITNIPPSEEGGAETRADIAGRVSGKVASDYMVVIYARAAGAWYIQPEAGSVHNLQAGDSWASWTHTGTRYAALVVRREFEPFTRLDMLPETNDYILAIDVVDGRPKPLATVASDTARSSK